MRVAIVYESMFGNTRLVANAIADGLRDTDPNVELALTSTVDADAAGLAGADLVIVGAPTHAFRMSTPASRREAVHPKSGAAPKGAVEPGADGQGMRDVLAQLPRGRVGQRGAAFDTRMRGPITGSAAQGMARRLKRAGYALACPAIGFAVQTPGGPLVEGELDRARAWGARLAPRDEQRAPDAPRVAS